MQERCILRLDEVDTMQTEIGFVLQRIVEPDGHVVLTDTGGDSRPPPGFRLAATANTLGSGCDSGLYQSDHELGTIGAGVFASGEGSGAGQGCNGQAASY